MRKVVVMAGLSVMLQTGTVLAQPASIALPAKLYTGAMVADWMTTQAVLSNGGREDDPLARPFVGHGVAPALIGATIDASLTYLGIRLAEHHRKVGRVVLWLAVGARSAVVVSNARAMQR